MEKTAPAKPKLPKSKKYMLVRVGLMNTLGLFEHNESNIPKRPARVVVKTERGLELGHLVGHFCPYKTGHFRLSLEQIKNYFDYSDIDISLEPTGKFIRFATHDDLSEERHLQKIAQEELNSCRRFAKELNLPMKIVDAEHIFGGERIIFYFMSDGRVDFRELVKKVAHEHQTRIEMRQIGSRDEAKLLGDLETCGQQCCCQRFLKALKPVNMRMAKMQKATLDPSKISGYCGRLKCCLRYEDKTYTELKRNLPKKNDTVKTNYGKGTVVDTHILTQLVVVEHDDGTKIAVPVEELEIVSSTTTKNEIQDSTLDDENQQDSENKNSSKIQSNDLEDSQRQT